MYEFRKNMGDVCKDVSSSIEERKDVLSEEQQYDRDSEPRRDEVKLLLSDTTELGIEDYIIDTVTKKIRERYIEFDPVLYFKQYEYLFEMFQIQINMMISGKECYFKILFNSEEMFKTNIPIEEYILQNLICFIDEEIKKYI